MALKKTPFQSYRTEEERAKDKSKVMTLRLNKQDQRMLKEMQKIFDVQSEGRMLKICMYQYWNVLRQGFSPSYLRYLLKADRDRLSHYKDLEKSDQPKF